MCHNRRLANPFDPYTKQLTLLRSKKKPTTDDLLQQMLIEARGGAYETPDGLLGLPQECVWATIHNAAKRHRLGEEVKRSLSFDPGVVPVLTRNGSGDDLTFVDANKFCGDLENIDYRLVVVQRSRVMRARIVVMPWVCEMVFELRQEDLAIESLQPVLQRAGPMGTCERRPLFGTFECTVL
jgi:hypothetical protein